MADKTMNLGYAYVLPQSEDDLELYSYEEALYRGTVFKALDIPYEVYGKVDLERGEKNAW